MIIQAFIREMSLIIEAYGGYILKYMGDAILAFYPVNIVDHPYLQCINAMNCVREVYGKGSPAWYKTYS